MIDTVILHMSLTHQELQMVKDKFPKKLNYNKKREVYLNNSNVLLSLYMIDKQDISFQYLRLTIYNVSTLLQKQKITNSDYDTFVFVMNEILAPYNLNLITFQLREIHYKLDIPATNKEKDAYLNAMLKYKGSYYNVERQAYHNSVTGRLETVKFKPKKSVKAKKKEGAHEITFYDKDAELIAHPDKIKPWLNDILRAEIKVKKKLLDKYVREHKIEKNLRNYFDSGMREYIFEHLLFKRFVGYGDYYSISEAKQILKGDKLESKCIKVLKQISKFNYDTAVENTCASTVSKYVNVAWDNGINHALIGLDRLPSLLTVLKNDTMYIAATPTI